MVIIIFSGNYKRSYCLDESAIFYRNYSYLTILIWKFKDAVSCWATGVSIFSTLCAAWVILISKYFYSVQNRKNVIASCGNWDGDFFSLIKVFIKIATGIAQCNKKLHFFFLQPKLLLELIPAVPCYCSMQALSAVGKK